MSRRALIFSRPSPSFKEIQILWRENWQVSVPLGPEKRVDLKMRLGGQRDWVLCQWERSFFPGQPLNKFKFCGGKTQVSVPLGPEKRVELENETWKTNRLGPGSVRALVFFRASLKKFKSCGGKTDRSLCLWDPKREWNLKMRLWGVWGQIHWVLCIRERSFFPGLPHRLLHSLRSTLTERWALTELLNSHWAQHLLSWRLKCWSRVMSTVPWT